MKGLSTLLALLFFIFYGHRNPFVNASSFIRPTPLALKHVGSAKSDDLSRVSAWEYICCHPGLRFPHIVFKQAIMESGLVSDIALVNHNIFGMRLPRVRATTAIGSRNGYAVYSSWQSSVDDYALFQKGFTGSSESDYYLFLRSYGDSAYVSNLKKAMVTIPKTSNPCKN